MRSFIQYGNQLRELFAAQQLAVLATDAGGRPYTNLVAFAATDDLKTLVFATLRETRKFSNITHNPHVSLLIDSRSNQVTDFQDAVALTALGTGEEVSGEARDTLLSLYLARHAHLSTFVRTPSCALVAVAVREYCLVSRFQNVDVWKMSQ
ncbi:MAG: pyridoxamine 5'-phosphate oxidase family protein [Desulfococcus multivorans]|jgi:nitroimidazol reductase NimA-like FMN-containing flavoprotein (pyridoxamine 5'-phosphate oxidase superfamily)|uniref:pyridoxamine 5'-phosphate oxidase family protein n=1 Tax=Desulfococcus sp. TaxID=2025834 RepID=UPI002A3D6A9F|nr:pyridoxamine 5'-phosphate oxidase family protein [Desulfococcus multivorans]